MTRRKHKKRVFTWGRLRVTVQLLAFRKRKKEIIHVIREYHLHFLDQLSDSGVCDMQDAKPYLMDEFVISKKEAREILAYWHAVKKETIHVLTD